MMYMQVAIVLLLCAAKALADCVCSHCINSNNCTFGIYGGHCTLGVHINVSTEMPLFIEQKCVSNNFLSILDCPEPDINSYDDLIEVCCKDPFCNECPLEILVQKIKPEYLDLLYDLFPESCRENVSFQSTSSHISSTITFITHSPNFTSFPITTTSSPITTTMPPNEEDSPNTTSYVLVFAIMASLGVLVLLSVVVVFALLISFVKRSRSRRVTETPFCTNQAFADFRPENSVSSSNALGENRLLQTRTLVDDVKFTKQLGRGRFGSVYLGIWGGKEIAVKVYDSHHETEWLREVDIYNTYMLTYPNILKFISSDMKETGNHLAGDTIHLLTCLEYHPNGNLQEYLERKKDSLEIHEGFLLATSFLDGLYYLHTSVKTGSNQKPGIAHRDIKSPNILVKSNFTSCIGDLGLAIKQQNDTGVDIVPTNKLSGTRRYLPPEVLDQSMNFERFQSYVAADIYAAALVLWEIFNSTNQCSAVYRPPYYEHVECAPSLESMRSVVVTRNLRPNVKPFVLNENLNFLSNVLSECWSSAPLARPSALNINKKLKNSSLSI